MRNRDFVFLNRVQYLPSISESSITPHKIMTEFFSLRLFSPA